MFNNKIRESFLARNFPSILFCPKHGFPSANIVPENYEFVLFSLDPWQPDFDYQCINAYRFKTMEEVDIFIEQQIILSAGKCHRMSKSKDHIREHIESHIGGLQFSCDVCGSVYKSRANLRKHKARNNRIYSIQSLMHLL